MPRRAYALIGALVAFMVVVGSVLAWASLSGTAGSQRGLVIHSDMARDVLITFESGQSGVIGPDQRERAFVVKREQFPQVLRASTPDGGQVLYERRFEYAELAEADFRISIDGRGFYPTTDLRDPTPTPAA